MIHYHGLPITPATAAVKAISGGHAFVSFLHSNQLSLAIEICQSFAVDNGAFSAWKSGSPIVDWGHYYEWVDSIKNCPNCEAAKSAAQEKQPDMVSVPRAALIEVLRISDRQHFAWEEVKSALLAAQEPQ
jgi:hypothetical protein